MNRAGLASQVQDLFGGDIMNPQNQSKWMDKPAGDSSLLALLKPLDSLFIKQVISLTDMMTPMAGKSKFGVFNDKNEQVYFAFEESDICQRVYCPATRGFDLRVVDSTNQEVIYIKREFKCCAGHSWCACVSACSHEITVESPPGTLIGSISQECSFYRPHYVIKDDSGNSVLKIVGPGCICDGPYPCCCENKFMLVGTDGESQIGFIQKKYRGYIAEALTSADSFSLQIPKDLDVRMKAMTLSAVFLIDFAHFSQAQRRRR